MVRYGALFAFHLIYFTITGLTSFLSKYYAEIGMSDSLIGVLMSLPTVAALLFTPALGALSDRVPRKRYLLAAELLVTAVVCAVAAYCRSFWALLAVATAFSVSSVTHLPIATTISLEYCRETGRAYGPIRLLGTVGFQLGLLGVALFLTDSLNGLYPMMAVAAVVSLAITFAMPNVQGHQHEKQRVPLSRLFADRHVRTLYGVILFATIGSQFHVSFFAKHLGDLGMSNATASWITLLSVLLELPFLAFGDRIARRGSVWTWIWVGIVLTALRWVGLSIFRTAGPILAVQLCTGICVLACFEFVPSIYLNRRVPAELQGSAQTILTLTTFGVGRIIGSMLGGVICERTGIPAVYAGLGAAMLVGAAFLWRPLRHLIQTERKEEMQCSAK